ncbi:hypothetical protein M436DRAFT_86291 [Aureobasidium namibiae CBS 147.97]|uniref:Uncharacterized protein n=1 Tax=Aureobasidium namibiae CBS 147.97 TaxID=1043004 RepID=A0A074WF90_9PEZI
MGSTEQEPVGTVRIWYTGAYYALPIGQLQPRGAVSGLMLLSNNDEEEEALEFPRSGHKAPALDYDNRRILQSSKLPVNDDEEEEEALRFPRSKHKAPVRVDAVRFAYSIPEATARPHTRRHVLRTAKLPANDRKEKEPLGVASSKRKGADIVRNARDAEVITLSSDGVDNGGKWKHVHAADVITLSSDGVGEGESRLRQTSSLARDADNALDVAMGWCEDNIWAFHSFLNSVFFSPSLIRTTTSNRPDRSWYCRTNSLS